MLFVIKVPVYAGTFLYLVYILLISLLLQVNKLIF